MLVGNSLRSDRSSLVGAGQYVLAQPCLQLTSRQVSEATSPLSPPSQTRHHAPNWLYRKNIIFGHNKAPELLPSLH